jgi:hypothetical protein
MWHVKKYAAKLHIVGRKRGMIKLVRGNWFLIIVALVAQACDLS